MSEAGGRSGGVGGGGVGGRRTAESVRADLIEGQEEFVGVRALLERQHRAEIVQRLSRGEVYEALEIVVSRFAYAWPTGASSPLMPTRMPDGIGVRLRRAIQADEERL